MNVLAITDPAAAGAARPRASPEGAAAAKSSTAAPAARYPNPILVLDSTSGALVLEYRNVVTGTVESEDPPRAAQRYRQAQQLAAAS